MLGLISEKELVVWAGKDGREVDLEVNIEKAKQMFMYWYQKAGPNHNSNVSYKFFRDMAKLKYCDLQYRSEWSSQRN